MENDLNKVIERTALIENLLDQVIFKYSSPRDEATEFFRYILLHSSVISLGAKVKLVKYIARKLEVFSNQRYESLDNLLSYRNAFAHHGLQSHPTLEIGKTSDEVKQKFMLYLLRFSGNLDKKSRATALEDFNKNFESTKNLLINLKKTIDNKI